MDVELRLGDDVPTGGVFYVWAANLNQDVGAPPQPYAPGVFSAELEDKRNAVERSAISLLAIGGDIAATGFVLYTIGQWKITSHHKSIRTSRSRRCPVLAPTTARSFGFPMQQGDREIRRRITHRKIRRSKGSDLKSVGFCPFDLLTFLLIPS